jgi:hypothetical protein
MGNHPTDYPTDRIASVGNMPNYRLVDNHEHLRAFQSEREGKRVPEY